jgi:hypothetical protein
MIFCMAQREVGMLCDKGTCDKYARFSNMLNYS